MATSTYNVGAAIGGDVGTDREQLVKQLQRAGFWILEDSAPGDDPDAVAVFALVNARDAAQAVRSFVQSLRLAGFTATTADAVGSELDQNGDPVAEIPEDRHVFTWSKRLLH